MTRTQGFDLELYRERPGRWVLRALEGDGRPFAVAPTLAELEPLAIALAEVVWQRFNDDGSCELFWRHAVTGVIRKRNTYGRDPRVSVG